IRDRTVTGVQTCALPIYPPGRILLVESAEAACDRAVGEDVSGGVTTWKTNSKAIDAICSRLHTECCQACGRGRYRSGRVLAIARSEERRVGKECRYGWWR